MNSGILMEKDSSALIWPSISSYINGRWEKRVLIDARGNFRQYSSTYAGYGRGMQEALQEEVNLHD